MNQRIGKIIAGLVLILGFGGLIVWKLMSQVDYSKYNLNDIVGANADNGYIADHVKGPEDAPVKIVEYADYQCEYCALTNPYINKLVEEYNGKVAVIFRNFLLSYHSNATAAASAANAAGLQGYWKEYADTLFTNQNDWYYAESTERLNIFVNYFNQVSGGEGDVEKFKSDMRSDEVSKKISFDIGAAKLTDMTGTPAFYLNGEGISIAGKSAEEDFLNLFREKIDAALKATESGAGENNSSSEGKTTEKSE